MDEKNKTNKTPDQKKSESDMEFASKIELGHDMKILGRKIFLLIKSILSITETEYEATTDGIKRDMVFRGPTAWILMFSVLIASIGLNVNSTAVIIGAMLISPLMAPILGVGLAVGTNDWETLTRALTNLGIAVFIGLLTSALYFALTPLTDPQSELLSRTKPTFLDVLIALFGGFAGIIAGSRKEKSNVIPGVAIATALMPPLCTAGYGIAMWDGTFFWGAIYLFFINSVFISIATLIGVKYLRFPVHEFLDPKREAKLRKYMVLFVIITIVPSAIIFINVIKESRFNAGAETFVNSTIQFSGAELINEKYTFNDSLSYIDLYFIGKEIPNDKVIEWRSNLKEFSLVAKGSKFRRFFAITDSTVLKIHQAKDNTEALANRINDLSTNLSKEVRVGILEEIYKKNEKMLKTKDEKITFLENQLLRFKRDSIPVRSILNEMQIQNKYVNRISYANTIETDTSGIVDTIPTVLIEWDRGISRYNRNKEQSKFSKWLKVRLKLDTVRVVEY